MAAAPDVRVNTEIISTTFADFQGQAPPTKNMFADYRGSGGFTWAAFTLGGVAGTDSHSNSDQPADGVDAEGYAQTQTTLTGKGGGPKGFGARLSTSHGAGARGSEIVKAFNDAGLTGIGGFAELIMTLEVDPIDGESEELDLDLDLDVLDEEDANFGPSIFVEVTGDGGALLGRIQVNKFSPDPPTLSIPKGSATGPLKIFVNSTIGIKQTSVPSNLDETLVSVASQASTNDVGSTGQLAYTLDINYGTFAVPEPGTGGALALCVVGLGLRGRRRR